MTSAATDVLDLGCGTGRLAIALAARGHLVTGVDPARASLDRARGKPGGDRVTWVDGSTGALPDGTRHTTWVEVTSVVDGAVACTHHYDFADGDRREFTATLRLRPEPAVRAPLTATGFTVEHLWGGRHRDPVGHPDGEFLAVARAGSLPAPAHAA